MRKESPASHQAEYAGTGLESRRLAGCFWLRALISFPGAVGNSFHRCWSPHSWLWFCCLSQRSCTCIVSSHALWAGAGEASETHTSNGEETDRCYAIQEHKRFQRRGATHTFGDAFSSLTDSSILHLELLLRSTPPQSRRSPTMPLLPVQ